MLLLIASFAGLGGFLFGYDLGLIAGALVYMEASLHLRESSEEVIVGMAKLGAVFGTFVGGALMHDVGRRRAIAWNSVFFLLGPLVMAAASGPVALSLGRFVVGLGVGASAVVVPAYVAEMSPPERRGAVVITYELMLCLGMIASGLVDFALRDAPGNWRLMVAAPVVPAVGMLVGMRLLPESPRWLVIRGRLPDALEVIHGLREGPKGMEMLGEHRSTARVEAELMDLWSAVEKENADDRARTDPNAETPGGDATEPPSRAPSLAPTRLGPSALDRPASFGSFVRALSHTLAGVARLPRGEESRAFRVATWLAFFNQASCSTSVINFAPQILERTGVRDRDEAVLFAAAVSATKLAGVAASMLLVDRVGRRFLLVSGSLGTAASMVALAAAYAAANTFACLLAMCAFMLCFSASWAGVFWVVASELFGMRIKSAALSATAAWLFAVGAAVDFAFLSAAPAMGAWTFGLVACVCAAGGVYVWMELPETKGRTLAEVQAMLAADGGSGGFGRIRERASYAPQVDDEREIEVIRIDTG